jgi:serine phosphatase RsbU (regulator of sigma subunit)
MLKEELHIAIEKVLESGEEILREDPRRAYAYAQEIAEQVETGGDEFQINKVREFTARCYQSNGNYHRALQVCLEALQYFESVNDYSNAAMCLNTLGAVYNYLGDYEKRLQTNLTCLSYRRKGGDEAGEISTLSNIGDTYNTLGNHDKALEYFQLCLQFNSISPRTKAIVIHNIGETEFFKGNYDAAIDQFVQSILLAKNTSYYIIEEAGNAFLARIYFGKQNIPKTIFHLDEAENIVRDKKYKSELPSLLRLRAQCAEYEGDNSQATALYKQYIEITEEIRAENDTRSMQDLQFAYRVEKLQEENRIHKEKNQALRQAYLKIAQQNRLIEEKNRAITDSINYALKIQTALLPSPWRIARAFSEYFIISQPRDIVSGDFYWLHEGDKYITLALADCTGHGVPGALMSIVGIDCLNIAITDESANDPASLLTILNEKIVSALNSDNETIQSTDGMDISVLMIDKLSGHATIASANRPVYICTSGMLNEIKQDKISIGGYYIEKKEFTNHFLGSAKGMTVYMFSDGIPDQFGGERGKKLKSKGVRSLIESTCAENMDAQEKRINDFIRNWKGNQEQLDDISMIAVRF